MLAKIEWITPIREVNIYKALGLLSVFQWVHESGFQESG